MQVSVDKSQPRRATSQAPSAGSSSHHNKGSLPCWSGLEGTRSHTLPPCTGLVALVHPAAEKSHQTAAGLRASRAADQPQCPRRPHLAGMHAIQLSFGWQICRLLRSLLLDVPTIFAANDCACMHLQSAPQPEGAILLTADDEARVDEQLATLRSEIQEASANIYLLLAARCHQVLFFRQAPDRERAAAMQQAAAQLSKYGCCRRAPHGRSWRRESSPWTGSCAPTVSAP